MFKMALVTLFSVFYFFASSQIPAPLKNGVWRAELQRADGNKINFNFEVKDSAGKRILYIRNASERLLVENIRYEGDSVFIVLPFFESQIRAAIVRGNELHGVWSKRLTDKYQLTPFTAFYDQHFRFKTSDRTTVTNITGRWAVAFDDKDKNTRDAVGEFVQTGNHVTGTFLHPTGDDRYLEGVVDGDSLRLSCFDGGHAFLFTAKINNDQTLTGGRYYSGPVFSVAWSAKKDESAQLPDEFSITKMREGQSAFDFTFRDIDGKTVSLKDARFRNKVVIVQIMGSWCPNCMDETSFLSGVYEKYKMKGVEIIGLAYERSTDFERSQHSLRSFQQKFNVQYPILITGVSVNDSLRTEKTLPQLEKIEGFPTTIFIGRQGMVEKIHTGFNGPGTGEHYEEEKKVFYKIMDGLIQ